MVVKQWLGITAKTQGSVRMRNNVKVCRLQADFETYLRWK